MPPDGQAMLDGSSGISGIQQRTLKSHAFTANMRSARCLAFACRVIPKEKPGCVSGWVHTRQKQWSTYQLKTGNRDALQICCYIVHHKPSRPAILLTWSAHQLIECSRGANNARLPDLHRTSHTTALCTPMAPLTTTQRMTLDRLFRSQSVASKSLKSSSAACDGSLQHIATSKR